MEEKVTEVLKEIGLGKVEIEAYLDLLRVRVSTAAETAKRTHQHRSNVYEALKRLQQKGFITERLEQGKRYFESKLPEVIFSYLKQKESEVKDILPILESYSKKRTEPETTSVSYGLARLRAILYNIQEFDGEILFWGIFNDMNGFLGEAFLQGLFLKNRAKRKKPTRLLYNGKFDLIKKIAKIKHQKVRWLPKQNYKSMIIICGDSVYLVVFNEPVMVVEMHGKEISKWYASQFEILWKRSKRPFMWKEIITKKAKYIRRKLKNF